MDDPGMDAGQEACLAPLLVNRSGKDIGRGGGGGLPCPPCQRQHCCLPREEWELYLPLLLGNDNNRRLLLLAPPAQPS